MTAALTNGTVSSTGRKMTSRTITGLKRWSCQNAELPRKGVVPLLTSIQSSDQATAVSQVKAIHIYDFDNTCGYWLDAPDTVHG